MRGKHTELVAKCRQSLTSASSLRRYPESVNPRAASVSVRYLARNRFTSSSVGITSLPST